MPDKKALAALKEAKRKLDELYREVTSRKASGGVQEKETDIARSSGKGESEDKSVN